MEEILDAAEPAGARADALDQAGRVGVDPPLGRGRAGRRIEERSGDRLVRWRVGGAERRHRACIRTRGRFRICGHDRFTQPIRLWACAVKS